MTSNEIYKIVYFEKTTNYYNKIIISTQNNLIIVSHSAKQHGAQINNIWPTDKVWIGFSHMSICEGN
jgi:hypothetical protein